MGILFPFYFFLIFHQIASGAANDSSQNFQPSDSIALDCGSSDNNNPAFDDLTWELDINHKFFPQQGQNNASITSTAVHPPAIPVPYQTARLSRSEFSYSFPVTAGQKFISLHFYPDIYGDFDSSKAFFSVKAANYSLLRNFSGFLSIDALDGYGMVKEFCLNVEKQNFLNITFTPDVSIK